MMMKFILLLAAFAAVNIEASPILVDTTKFLVLSGKSPYISLEITEMEDMFECYVVLKPMNGGDKINQLTQGIDTLNNGAQTLNVGVNSYIDGAKSLSDGIQSYVVSVSTIDKNESAILQSIIDYDTVINSKEVTLSLIHI